MKRFVTKRGTSAPRFLYSRKQVVGVSETLLLSAAGLKKFEKKKHWERRVRRGDERFATGCVVGPQACLRAFAENRSDRAGRTGVLSDKPKGSLRA